MTEKVLYQELLPHELVERVNACPIAYLPVGTLEWHGYHLPYGVDMMLPLEVFKRIAARVGGVVLPPLFLGPDGEREQGGEAFYGMDFISFEDGHPQHLTGSAFHIPKELYIRLLENILKNLKRNGFAAMIGHGHGPCGNILLECKERFEREYGIFISNLYELGEDMLVDHAAFNETSLMLALDGRLVDLSRMPENAPTPGVWGEDPRVNASAEAGERFFVKNEELVSDFLLKLKKTLAHPQKTLDFHHVRDLTKTLNVLLVGGGGREHALAAALASSPFCKKLYCAPGNAGIAGVAECVPAAASDVDGIVAWAKENGIDFVVVAPDDPLALGLVDRCKEAGLRAFGPTRAAAEIEWSKVFSKGLMKKYGIPSAAYETFDDYARAAEWVQNQPFPLVVKADGLALGKGVVIAQDAAQAGAALREMLVDGRFKDAGRRVVVEEYLQGREVTVLCFTDGQTVYPMPASRDHKRARDGDTGENTGGMGAVTPVPEYTAEIAERCMREIFLPTVEALRAEGRTFAGVLYFGLMLTGEGPKVIEYNARFGDPEAQALLSLLESDLLEIMLAVEQGRLASLTPRWADAACACVVLASGGYPGDYIKGFPITGLENLPEDVFVFHAGTARDAGGRLVTAGGRVLGVCARGDTLKEALGRVYGGIDRIRFDGAFYRKDIGTALSPAPDG